MSTTPFNPNDQTGSIVYIDGSGHHARSTSTTSINASQMNHKSISINDASGNISAMIPTAVSVTDGTNTTTINASSITTPSLIGTATKALNILTTSDNSNLNCYIPFSKTKAAADTLLYLDDTTNPFTFNPSTGVLTATTFSGDLSGTALKVATTQGANLFGYGICFVGNNPTTASQAIYTSQYFLLSGASSSQVNLQSYATNTRITIPASGTGTFDINNGTTSYLSISSAGVVTTPSLSATTATIGTLNYTTLSPAINLGMTLLSTNTLTAFTGASSSQSQAFTNIFNSSYANYRIIITASNPSTMGSNFPYWEITATSGTGTQPTAWYSNKETFTNTGASTGTLAYANSAVLPVTLSNSNNSNRNLQFDIMNVGFTQNAAGGYASIIVPKQSFINVGSNGWMSNTAQCYFSSGVSMTGFTLQLTGSTGSVATNGTMKVYGYN